MKHIPTRMQIKFTESESLKLAQVARENHRDPRAQAAVFIRQALELDGKALSPMSIAALIGVAKEAGLDDINDAVAHLIRLSLIADAPCGYGVSAAGRAALER